MKNNIFRIYPLLFIPLLGLIYYTTFFMMSQTTDASFGFQWPIVLGITIQFAILWVLAQVSLNKLIKNGWKININLFVLGVLAIVVVNNCLYFFLKAIVIAIYHPELSVYNNFILGLNTLEGVFKRSYSHEHAIQS